MRLLAAATALTLFAAPVFALDFYVAPNGDDAGAGTEAAPFATLTKARDRVRELRKAGELHEAVTVYLRAGLYPLKETFKLDAADSGTEAAPVTYRGYRDERPILSGGAAVTEFTEYKGQILKADLHQQGLAGVTLHQLLFKGERQPLARYPNFDPANPYGGGWAYADGEMWPMYAPKEGEDRVTLQVKPQDWRSWARPEEVEVFIFPRYNWWNDILQVKAVDPAKHTITTVKNASYAMRANDRYYFQNALEELDAPGEWYYDKKAATLYFWPPEPLAGRPVLVPRLQGILEINKAEHLHLQGLDFECCEGMAVTLRETAHCTVAACAFRAVGGFGGGAIAVSGGRENGVIGCDIASPGRNGISLSGGDRKTLTPAGNFAENCYIHHTGVFYKQGVGVALDGVGQRVSHCLIHDTPRFAIQFSGNSHILEYNHLRHIALETEDVGATYCGGRDWLSPRGSIIRYNFIHDVLGFGWNGKWTSPYFAWGVYLDDNSGGVDVIGNIVARCGRSCIHGHSARDCRVENNIFVEGGQRQWEFNGWVTEAHFWADNIDKMVKAYESVQNEPAWQKMRGMSIHPLKIPDAEGRVMSGNVFERNLMAWKNPEAKALNVANFDASRNEFDYNLYWHYGQPILTGQRKPGPPIGGNLAPNGMMGGEPGSLPKEWTWQVRPLKESRAAVAEEGTNKFLRIEGGIATEKKRDNYPIVVSRELDLQPGTSYLLRARIRSSRPDAKALLMLQCYIPPHDGKPGHFWGSSPSNVQPTAEWKPVELSFSIPKSGERGWHPEMKKFRIRIDWNQPDGTLDVDDLVLQQVAPLDEWKSWQETGGDRHSIIADPKFVDAAKDDYRLEADSPAFALGFQQIPTEKIGPYADPLRASWPIQEAEGAREHPAH